MKKKIISLLFALLITITPLAFSTKTAYASEAPQKIQLRAEERGYICQYIGGAKWKRL